MCKLCEIEHFKNDFKNKTPPSMNQLISPKTTHHLFLNGGQRARSSQESQSVYFKSFGGCTNKQRNESIVELLKEAPKAFFAELPAKLP